MQGVSECRMQIWRCGEHPEKSLLRRKACEETHPNDIKRPKDTSNEVFEIAAICMYVRATPKRHGLVEMFENTGCFTDRSSSDGYSYHYIQFRFGGQVVNRGFQTSMFRQILMHPRERLMIGLADICSKIPGVSRIVAAAIDIHAISSSSDLGCV
ncbi:hypothetical protein TNCV_1539711 [Trichonephila clavipes]|nr:hypothetical protein TNCV_1539711 [Trichonephila clavipes]